MKITWLVILVLMLSLGGWPGAWADEFSEEAQAQEEVIDTGNEDALEENTEEDLYSSPALDPNLQGHEQEGRLHGNGFTPVDSDLNQILDYSRTSERYPTNLD